MKELTYQQVQSLERKERQFNTDFCDYVWRQSQADYGIEIILAFRDRQATQKRKEK